MRGFRQLSFFIEKTHRKVLALIFLHGFDNDYKICQHLFKHLFHGICMLLVSNRISCISFVFFYAR